MRRHTWQALVLIALVLPWMPGLPQFWVSLACQIGIAAIIASGLVVLTGVAGMTSFVQAGLMGVGAYASAVVSASYGMSPWLGLPAALLAALVVALAMGAITLRLSGHYLALGTIAWSVSLYYLYANLDFLGHNDGIPDIPPLSVAGFKFIDVRASAMLIGVSLILVSIATANLLDSRWGRAMRALRGGAVVAASVGVDLMRARMLAFLYAALLAGFGGWLFAHLQRAVSPSPFGLVMGIQYLLMAVLGGAAALPGALLGASLVVLINNELQDWLPLLVGAGVNAETIVFGILLVLMLQAAPDGLWPLIARRRKPRIHAVAKPAPAVTRTPQAGQIALRARGLQRSFGGLLAVADLTFTLHYGELLGLIGPNGAGKSTSFNLISGLAPPDQGSVTLGESEMRSTSPQAMARGGLARSFQHVKLVPSLTVIENVALGAHLRGRASALDAILRRDRREEAEIFAIAAAQLARCGLADLANLPATGLALGQQRIVEIARALAAAPSVLLLDEPAAGLRHGEKQALAALLRQLRTEGMAILLVEHDMEFIMSLADRLVVMDFGTVIAQGKPEHVRRDPAVIEAYLGGAA
jgi:branched-chain amino acid transport system permease protein